MKIYSRDEWGAKPPRSASSMGQGSFFFVHHSVTRSVPASAKVSDEKAAMRELQNIAFGRNFSDVSYSFAAFRSGRIYEGRGWGKVGAHTYGYNSTAYAVVCVGNYENEQPTEKQLQAIAELYKEGIREGHLRAGAPIHPHRQVAATACPGSQVFAKMGEIRALAAGAKAAHDDKGPRPSLARGDEGWWVEKAQKLLNRRGANLDVDGNFGLATEKAVRAFQKKSDLPVDGVIGSDTWARLGRTR